MTAATTRTRTVPLGEIDLVVAEAGRGGRPLLLVHGFTGAKEDFRDHLEPLAAAGHWVVAPDLRGHGASSHPAGEDQYVLDRFVADLEALVGALGWDRFDLLGHSMGGMVAQVLATRHPQDVSRLVLMDTGTGPVEGMDRDLMNLGIEVCREQGVEAILAVQKMGEQALDTPAHRRMVEEVPGWVEFEDAKMLASSSDMWCSVVAQLLSIEDRLDSLRSLPMPTLVLVGDQDRPFLATSEAMAAAIPDARLVVVPDAGHSPQFEAPAAWLEAVSGFLARTPPTTPS
jgi:pimeloyl-ACP methyl ester carboxylesterase